MNASILGLRLSLALGCSPLFSSAGGISLRNSVISKSFSTAIYSLHVSCKGNRFSNLLETAVVIGSCYEGAITYSQLVANSTISCVSNCLFSNITISTATGACVYCSSSTTSVYVFDCVFQFCVSSGSPSSGGIYVVGNLSAKCCFFNQVYRAYGGDGAYTNTIYSTGLLFSVELTTFYRSGLTDSSAGDSTFYTNGGQVHNDNLNATQCFGTTGGACGSFQNSLVGSASKYTTVIRCGQWCSEEIKYNSNVNPTDANIINNTNFYNCYIYIENAQIGITRFIFSGNSAPYVFGRATSSDSISCTDCIADVSSTSLTFQLYPSTGSFVISSYKSCAVSTNQFTKVTIHLLSSIQILVAAQMIF